MVDKVEVYLTGTRLEFSPEKSELYRPILNRRWPKRYMKERECEEIDLHEKVPIIEQVRVLVLNIESKRTNSNTLIKIVTKVTKATGSSGQSQTSISRNEGG